MTTIIINEELGSNLVTIYGFPTNENNIQSTLERNYLQRIVFMPVVLE